MTIQDQETAADARPTPPYVPYTTFKNYVHSLKKNGLPPRIDKSVMRSMSGATQGTLIATFRYLGLIDKAGRTQPSLTLLVADHGEEGWAGTLAGVLMTAYESLLLDLDLSTATPQMVHERFAAVGGSVRDKAVRFLLAALEDTGENLSAHLKKSGATSGGSPRRTRRPKTAGGASKDAPPIPLAPGGGQILKYPLRVDFEATVVLPKNLRKADVERLYKWLSTIPYDEEEAPR